MSVTTQISWGDGSGDKIYLSRNASSGDQTVLVSSDANAGAARSKVVNFTAGNITRQLTVNQDAAPVPIQDTLEVNPSGYISRNDDGAWYSLSNPSNAYNPETNATYAQIRLTRGTEGAVTYIYFTFDTSSIPAGATINAISCKAKIYISNRTSSIVAVRQVQMFSGTTAKGTASTITGSAASVYDIDMGTWSRSDVNDVRLRLYAERGTTNLNSDYSFRMYGATLSITYTYMGAQRTVTLKSNI